MVVLSWWADVGDFSRKPSPSSECVLAGMGPAFELAFSCLKKVAEFYGLWMFLVDPTLVFMGCLNKPTFTFF